MTACRLLPLLPLLPLLAACATSRVAAPVTPRIDYHQHLVSPAFQPIARLPARDARALLNDASPCRA